MTLETLLLFIPACFALNMAFGPNNLLSVSVGAQYGLGAAVLSAAGRLAAFIVMIGISACGLGAILAASEIAFTVMKTLGAAYLLWIGFRLMRGKIEPPSPHLSARSEDLLELARREFLVAAGNPKAVLIFTAFFPQFVAADEYWVSFATLGGVFLALELVAVAVYGYAGTKMRRLTTNPNAFRWFNRASGIGMVCFGGLLIFATRPSN
ncbi:MAG: LysE family translocator [Rhizobium sp.]|nr:LysE family translocator [Rhizobium sp.]